MPFQAPLALSNSVKEILLVGLIVLVPTVPVTFLAWNFLGRYRNRRGVSEEREIEAGRSPATPFAMISIVGTVIAVAAMAILLLVVAIRAVAA
jgi:heme/copper-type cytochrome/quinol oxidase subunit 2